MSSENDILRLNYWKNDYFLDSYLSVEVPRTASVGKLRDILLEKLRFPHESLGHLHVYKFPGEHPVNLESMEVGLAKLSISSLGKPLKDFEALLTCFGEQLSCHQLHFILILPSIKIRCFVRGEDDVSFQITAFRDLDLELFKEQIRDRHAIAEGLAPKSSRLALYKISTQDEELADILRTQGSGDLITGRYPLKTIDTNTRFSDELKIIVEYPIKVSRKWTANSEEEEEDTAKRLKLAETSPSYLTQSLVMKIQDSAGERILDRRETMSWKGCLPDDKIPPMPLQYEPFGHFLDVFCGYEKPDYDMLCSEVTMQVDGFTRVMKKWYKSDRERLDMCLPALNNIFEEAFKMKNFPYDLISRKSIETCTIDGCILGKHGEPVCILEMKNENCGSSVVPIVELCGYYHRFVCQVKEFDKEFWMASRFPMLGITIVGHEITFYALTWIKKPHYSLLTYALPCVDGSVGDEARTKLHYAFAAASSLLISLLRDSNTFQTFPPRSVKRRFPSVTQLPSVEDPTIPMRFTINNLLLAKPHSGQYLYIATGDNNQRLFIKFTKRYCFDLHKFCADKGYAPTLHGFARLPGNIYAIVMEYLDIEPDFVIPLEERENCVEQIKEITKAFHEAGFVHGDLRRPNFLYFNKRIQLVDFDWGGRDGETSYPTGGLNAELTVGRSRNDFIITRGDDDRILANTLGRINLRG